MKVSPFLIIHIFRIFVLQWVRPIFYWTLVNKFDRQSGINWLSQVGFSLAKATFPLLLLILPYAFPKLEGDSLRVGDGTRRIPERAAPPTGESLSSLFVLPFYSLFSVCSRRIRPPCARFLSLHRLGSPDLSDRWLLPPTLYDVSGRFWIPWICAISIGMNRISPRFYNVWWPLN